MKRYIFISYAHRDSQMVIPIIDELREAGVEVWYDEGIEAGTEWPETIERKLVECSAVIVFVSPASIASQNCRNEINLALSLRKEMLTVYLSETTLTGGMSLQLGTIQALFKYRHPNHRSFMQALLGSEFLAGYIDGVADAPMARRSPEPMAPRARGENPLDIIARAPRFYTVKFGKYPQSSMNPEPIKWIIVKKSCGEALLVAKDVLDCRDFEKPHRWSTSKMRSWLNGEFARAAFSATELECISENERFTDTTDGVEKTAERIFLLDVAEVRENFGSWLRAKHMFARPTAFAKRKGAYLDNKKFSVWWLRCSSKVDSDDLMHTDFEFYYNNIPFVNGRRAPYVYYHHSVQGKNAMTTCREANPPQVLSGIGVRPAIWVRYI